MANAAVFRNHGYFRKGFDVIAHRGSVQSWPENTLYAFEKALEVHPGCILELDVHCTRDQKIVVIHDPTTERTADRALRLSLTDYETIKTLDAAHVFSLDGGQTFPERGKNHRIPLLEEVLNAFPTSRVSVDIKEKSAEITELVVAAVQKCNGVDRVVLSSEHEDNLALVRKKHPACATGFSAAEVWQAFGSEFLFRGALFPKRGDVFQIPFTERFGPGGSIQVQVVNKKFVDLAHANGKKVHVWTINDPEEMMSLIELGVDGIVTDAPGLLAKVARQLGRELS